MFHSLFRELFATLAQFFMGDTTPAARLRMRQLRLSERTAVAMVDDETSTSDLDRAAALSPLLAREAVTIPVADDLSDRGMFTSAKQTDAALEQGAYGVAPSAMPVAAILGRSAAPAVIVPGVYRLDPALTAVKDRAEWTERERVLAVADSLLDKLLALEQAFLEIDSGNMILGDPIPAPPASGLTGTPWIWGLPNWGLPNRGQGCAHRHAGDTGATACRDGGADRQGAHATAAPRQRKAPGTVDAAAALD